MDQEDGFTLIEVVAVLAIVALMAALTLPMLRPGATTADLDATALRIATLLKADRYAAMRSGAPVVTALSASERSVTSGHGHGQVRAPAGVALDAILADHCAGAKNGAGIVFFPSGLSCGGVIGLARGGRQVEIRVNWLTGGVEIASRS